MKKHSYYIGILSNKVDDDNIRYVYKLDYDTKTALWKTWSDLRKENLKALRFSSKASAENIIFGLRCNCIFAILIDTYDTEIQ